MDSIASRVLWSACILSCCSLSAGQTPVARGVAQPSGELLFVPTPETLRLAEFDSGFLRVAVTDVAVADFDGDGWNDIAAAWFATHGSDPAQSQRVLTLLRNVSGEFLERIDLDLYEFNAQTPALSVFWQGTGPLGVGDFDGDGDADLAVAPRFGDELWFVENLGAWQFEAYLRFPFGANTTGNFITPQEMATADFDQDGRDELVYLPDAALYVDGARVHFWKTDGALADIYRPWWQTFSGILPSQQTRSLAIADFDADGALDLCFNGSMLPENDPDPGPILTFWTQLDPATGFFLGVHNEYPAVMSSDIAAVTPADGPMELLVADNYGQSISRWRRVSTQPVDFAPVGELGGYAGLAPLRGMAVQPADLDGDGDLDFITKQKLANPGYSHQIEATTYQGAGAWLLEPAELVDTAGFQPDPYAATGRPRDLAVADLFGNRLPEIVAGFFFTPATPDDKSSQPAASLAHLDLAIWANSCRGDANRDGATTGADVGHQMALLYRSEGDPGFDPHADLNRDGVISGVDIDAVIADYGCRCATCDGVTYADTNCDGRRNYGDIDAFITALLDPEAYADRYPNCSYLSGDINGDGTVDNADIDPFITLLFL